MPTTVNKLKGTLKLGDTATGVAMEAQVSNIGVPQNVTRDSPVTVLTGDTVQAAASYSWSLTGTVLLDLSDPDGVYYYVSGNQGQEMPFEFLPIGAAGPTIAGICIVDGWSTEELAAGSIVTSKFTWPIQGDITITPPAARTAAAALMADTITVDILNGSQFDAALAAAMKEATEPRDGLTAAARELIAGSEPPRRSGRLAGSETAEAAQASRVRITVGTPYAAVIHWGWPGHNIGRQPWLVAAWLRNPGPMNALLAKVQQGLDKAAGMAPPQL